MDEGEKEMREIKFRVWDRKEKKFIETDSHTQVVITSNGLIFLSHTESVLFSEASMERLNEENVELMQYTGLKDVNGKDIYEGDIVVNSGLWNLYSTNKLQYVKRVYGEGEIFVVNLNVTGVELRHRNDWNRNIEKDFAPNGYNSEPYVDSHDVWNLQKTLEFIGNIYENPELLEVK